MKTYQMNFRFLLQRRCLPCSCTFSYSAVGAEIETGYLSVEQVTVRLENVLSSAWGASRFLP